ncbi:MULTISPECIES: Na+/H+ antiporter NhaC family protein [unclassified Haladaptatus]|uniref:Na+/H+ antiporter NhaC family protein n=1 Tax=unclassified Haladaptatus TaxID=2622732 RepID=UPI00209BF45F|nr:MULTISPECIES: Na+/H+ antiporter NhaC family protein [unclassified Haladaptatus]MCO8244140.1 Na+/H+ antiporter NhaC family protein [Haladaptatus sp. AB643]MCO8255945.1 Na+/H+ antiporter NhaC family protein [Haladaptatus sp. AB618]
MTAETYGLISLLPALIAIVLTLTTRQALLSLFAGIWLGATILVGWNPIAGAARGLQFVVANVTSTFNVKLLLFTFLIGAMLGMIFLSGGMSSVADAIVKRVGSSRQARLGTSILGMLIFFDSYASTMISGSVMRPVTDRFDVSREKLAYILDSTTAPTASIAVVSTWLGYEVGLIKQQFDALGIDKEPFIVFVQSIPFRFYSLFAIVLVFIIVLTDWDFGPMQAAERRAREKGKVLGDDANPLMETQASDIETPDHVDPRWWYFVSPILVLIFVTVFSLWFTGGGMEGGSFSNALEDADTASAILWAAFAGCGTILAILVGHARIELDAVSDSIFEGFKMVMFPVAILSLAWSIGSVSQKLGVGDYVVSISQGIITPELLPAVIFLSAAIISFCIGTSWGTMAILFPVAVPLAHSLGSPLVMAIGAILTGSLFGDHCSPISDTTVMSSMFAASDHVDHVNTQIPYAILAAAIATGAFLISGYTGIPVSATLLLGVALLIGMTYFLSEYVGVTDEIGVAQAFE